VFRNLGSLRADQSIHCGHFHGTRSGRCRLYVQDRGQLFTLQEDHPNAYAPGKRPFQKIIPRFATRGGRPWLSFGVMGGGMQPQGQTQILLNRIDYGLDNQAAGDAPRWQHSGSAEAMGEDDKSIGCTGLLQLETGVPDRTALALAEMGWRLGPAGGGFGRYPSVEPGGEPRRTRLQRGLRRARRLHQSCLLTAASLVLARPRAGAARPCSV
jgi:hypothetical protein